MVCLTKETTTYEQSAFDCPSKTWTPKPNKKTWLCQQWMEVKPSLHHSPAGWTCSAQRSPWSHQISLKPAWSHPPSLYPDVSSYNQSPDGDPPFSSGDAATEDPLSEALSRTWLILSFKFLLLYLNLLQIFFMEVLQWIDEVLLHLHVQSILNFCKLTHGFTHINQSDSFRNEDTANRQELMWGVVGSAADLQGEYFSLIELHTKANFRNLVWIVGSCIFQQCSSVLQGIKCVTLCVKKLLFFYCLLWISSPKLDSSPSSLPNLCMDSPRMASVWV